MVVEFANKKDIIIQGPPSDPADPTSVFLLDEEGNELWRFPSGTTKEQILEALAFANHAYRCGFEAGENSKISEIEKALTRK